MDLPIPLRLWFYLFSQCLFWHFEKLFWDASRCRHEILSVTWFMTAPPTTPPPSALTVHNPKTALFCLYRLKFKLWTSGVEGEGTICKVLIPCWELISNFTFNQVFYSLSSTAASSSFCCYWNYLWPPLRAWQRTPFGICKAELSKYPGKATNIFPTGCNIFSRLVVVFWLLLRSIFICHVALTAACCLLPLPLPAPYSCQPGCLPACLLLLRLILRALALIILIIIPIYARKYLRFTAYFSLDSSRFCFVLPFLPTSLIRSPSLSRSLSPLSCSFSLLCFYLTRNATSRNENV